MYGDFENIKLKHPNIDMLRVQRRILFYFVPFYEQMTCVLMSYTIFLSNCKHYISRIGARKYVE